MDKNNNKRILRDEKTVISEVGAKSKSAESNSQGQALDSGSSKLSNSQQKALTEIDTSFQSHPTEQGFVDAKRDADKALADNEIILNHRFVLKQTLGSGGMGTVYKAQDLRKVEARDNNPYVATKILNSDFKNHPDAFIALQREASRSHLLSHPNIVTVHDFDRDGNTIYMTMELLEGDDLEKVLGQHKSVGLPQEEAFAIFTDYCVALEFAHQKGIIHSDLKPGNIFVTKEEGTKVLDFGIARLALESKNTDHFDAGRIGAITPAYASLEMIGQKEPDPSDDVFAAALIVYELLTGRHPYNTISAASALAKGLQPERIESLSKRQWKALSNGLELRRENRTSSIRELLDGLTLPKQFPVYSIFSVILLSFVGWFVYNQFFAMDKLSRVIDETLVKATQCFETKDYQCTIESASAILEMSPDHQQALELAHQAKINQLAESVNQCVADPKVIECAIEEFEQLKTFIPNTAMLKKIEQQINSKRIEGKIETALLQAQQCVQNNDYECAIKRAEIVLELSENHVEAGDIYGKATEALKNAKATKQTNQKAYKTAFSSAKWCFSKKDYVCASRQAKVALKYKPSDAAADELYQNAIFAEKQQQENLKRANKVLQDGYLCLEKLDYSCAIAKSESALEFVPGHRRALQLKKDATDLQKKAKKSIEIG